MKIIAFINLSTKTSPYGIKLDCFENFCNTPLFLHTIKKLIKVNEITTIIIATTNEDIEAVKNTITNSGFDKHKEFRFKILDRKDNYNPALFKKRKWGLNSWRGGVNDAYCMLEYIDIDLLYEISKEEKADLIINCDAYSPLLSTNFLIQLLEYFRKYSSELYYVSSAAPPGLRWDIFSYALLNFCASNRVTFYDLLKINPEENVSVDPLHLRPFFPLDLEVISCPLRFTYDFIRQKEFLNLLVNTYGTDILDTEINDLVRKAKMLNFTGKLPRFVEIQITSRKNINYLNFTPNTTPDVDMSLSTFERICKGLSVYDDICISFAGSGEPLLNQNIYQMLAISKEYNILSTHLATDGILLNKENIARLLEIGVDIITILFCGATRDSYAKISGCDCFNTVMDNLNLLIEENKKQAKKSSIIIPEIVKTYNQEFITDSYIFYKQWIEKLNAVSIKNMKFRKEGYKTFPLLPPNRGICRKLLEKLFVYPDGSVYPCEILPYDSDHYFLGNVLDTPIERIYHSAKIDNMRNLHKTNSLTELPFCNDCIDWAYI